MGRIRKCHDKGIRGGYTVNTAAASPEGMLALRTFFFYASSLVPSGSRANQPAALFLRVVFFYLSFGSEYV